MLRTLLVPILMIGLFVSWFDSSHCLYEDQIHKWDWRQRFIGIDVDNCLRSNKESRELLFCVTGETNVISAINRKGEIAWRNVQEEQGKIIGSALSSTAEGLITVSLYKTRNESKLYLRKWSQDDFGYLIVEKNHFLEGNKNGDAVNCLASIDPVKSVVNVVCGESSSQLKSFQFSLSKDDSDSLPIESGHSSLEGSPTDVDLERDCITVGLKNIICLTRFSLHHIKLGESKWSSQNLPEAASSGVTYILERVTNQYGGHSNYFGLRTVPDKDNTESFHLYKLNIDSNGDGAVKLQTLIHNLQKVSILSGESHEQFFGIAPTNDGVEVFKIGSDWKLEKLFSSLIDTTSHANGVHRFSCIKFGSQIEFIVTFDDQQVVSYNLKGKVNWSREESLSSIIWSQFISLPYFSSSASSKNDNFELPNDFAFLANFLNRLYSQLSSIQEYIISSYGTFFTSEASRLAAIEDESKEKSLVSDVFGFHKLLFIVTERGKLFVLDNVRKGKIIWSHYDARLKKDIIKETKLIDSIGMKRARKCDKLPVLSVHLQRNNLFSPLVTIVSPLGYLISYNPLEGRVEATLDLDMRIKLSMLMYHADDQGVKGLILMNENDQVTFYPKSSRDTFLLHKDAYYMMVSKQTSEQVSGYSLRHLKHGTSSDANGDVARQVWSLNLPPLTGSCLQVRWKEVDEHVHSQGKVLADRAVLYKYLNPNLVALVNRGEESSEEGRINVVQFYLIDAVTGSIYYSVVHRRASDPVHLVHSENFIIYSFYNEKQRRIEISSLELFEGKEMPPPPPVRTPPKIIEHLSFIFPTGIRAMRETQTIRGITNKHILIALTSGGILSLPKIFLDPRRASFANSKYASSAAAMEEGGVYLPPYIPELPIPSEGIINYNQSVMDVNCIYVGVSSLESTSLLFITGLDIYYTRVTPSKTFDILKDDFDHLLIIIVLTALLLLSIATKYLASRKTLNAAWK